LSLTTRPSPEHRAAAIGRLFEEVREGLFVGWVASGAGTHDATLAANRHLKRLLGYAADVADADVLLFAPARFADQGSRTALLDQLGSSGHVTDYPVLLRRVTGALCWFEITAVAHGAEAGLLRVDALLRRRDEPSAPDDDRDLHVVHAEKMAALGETMSGVAHELNNPLATIVGWAERLAEEPLDDTARRGVDVILREGERAARLVRNLLTFARKRRSTRAMIDVNAIIRETLALRADAQRLGSIDAIVALAPSLPRIFADAHQLQQVLLNIVINAEQAMIAAHGRGSLLVRSRHVAERSLIAIEISDDGPGIARDIAARIFDPFFTTKAAGKGTGLGLSVAATIVREHGGRIRVEPTAARGATFVLELPLPRSGLA
jgi:signal transduction histidine kinase